MHIINKIVIGTAQFGINYGITNLKGKPSNLEIKKIFNFCKKNKLTNFDTANAYGSSEEILGNQFKKDNKVKFYTKLPVKLNKNISFKDMEQIIFRSLKKLNKNNIECVSFHRVDHLLKNQDKWLDFLKNLKTNKIINKYGVSIQNEKEFLNFIDITSLDYVQLPYNLIDPRWDYLLDKYKTKLKSKSLHIRSIFLQGLLLTGEKKFWKKTNYKKYNRVLNWIEDLSINYNCNKIDLCLRYIMAKENLFDGLIFGINNFKEIREIKNRLLFLEPFSKEDIIKIQYSRPKISSKLYNPIFWNK